MSSLPFLSPHPQSGHVSDLAPHGYVMCVEGRKGVCAYMYTDTNIGMSEGFTYYKTSNSCQDLSLGILNACHMLLTTEPLEP